MTKSINMYPCLDNPQSALRNAFESRKLDEFKFALVTLQANPNYVDTSNGDTIFEDILLTPNSGPYITLCIENGAELYEKNSFGKCPLHYAIDQLSPQNLKAFLENYDPKKINVKYDDRNALHLAFEIMPQHEDYEDAVECIKLLIDRGCSVNMPNSQSRTPFHLLLRIQRKLKNKHELVDFIMEKCDVDLYTYQADKMIDLFKKNNPHLQLPLKVDKEINLDYMQSLIRNRKNEEFMADYQKFKEDLEKGSDENKTNRFKEILDHLLYRAVEYDCEGIVQYLVDGGADVNAKKPSDIDGVYPALENACLRGNYKIVEILCKKSQKLTAISNKKEKNVLHLITEHFGLDPQRNPNNSYEKCFESILKICDNKIINQQDENGTTPLHYAARYKNEEAVMILLQSGAYIGTQDVTNDTPIDCMSHDTLKKFLDQCIVRKGRKFNSEKDEEEIIIDYNFLRPPKKINQEFGPEIAPLENITRHQDLRPLAAHPVLASFLFLKWSKLSLLLFLNLGMFSLFMVSLIYYIVLSQTLSPEEQSESTRFAIFKVLSFISIIMLFIRELIQFILSPFNYLKSIINYFEIALVVLGCILIWNGNGDPQNIDLRILRAVTILFAAYEFLQLIGTLPYMSISTHMVILKKVALTFLKSLLLYSILIVSFALCFFTLFGGQKIEEVDGKNATETATESPKEKKGDSAYNNFGYPGIAIIKTMVMLTGEFDAADLDLDRYDAFYSIIFLLFLFIMTIVVFNLLNALAIDDTQQIRTEGELVDLCERIKVLNKYEKIILSQSGWWMRLKKKISVFPHKIPFGKIVIHPDKKNEILTYKEATNLTSVGIVQEMQTFNNNNNSMNKLLPSKELRKINSKPMDGKIMKKIQNVFEERKKEEDDKVEALNVKFSSMQSEIKSLKSNIQELTDLLRKSLEVK